MQTPPALTFSDDQADAFDRVTAALLGHGIDLAEGTTLPMAEGKASVLAVVGKAGSGKTMLLAELYRALKAAGLDVVSGDYEGRRRKDRRTLQMGPHGIQVGPPCTWRLLQTCSATSLLNSVPFASDALGSSGCAGHCICINSSACI